MLIAGCDWFRPKSEPDPGHQLARVNEQVLYLRDIKDVGFRFASPQDSAKMVSETQMRTFYNENQENLKLGTDVVRMQLLKVANEAPKQDSIGIWMRSEDPIAPTRLEDYAQQYATEYSLEDSLWFSREQLDSDMPWLSEQYDLSQPQFIEHEQQPFTYFLNIADFKIKESTAPFQYVRKDIGQRILNKRKMQLRKEFNDNIYKDAAKNNTFEIF